MGKASGQGSGTRKRSGSNQERVDAMREKWGVGSEDIERMLKQAYPTMQRFYDKQGEEIDPLSMLLKRISDLNPVDAAERMLVSQMIAAHEAAMECFGRAMHPEQSRAGRDMNLRHAARLTSIYTKQVEALDKHRGKGQQKITVEHVNVHPGAQAIVGEVNTNAPARRSRDPSPTSAADEPASLTKDSTEVFGGEEFSRALKEKAPAPRRARSR